jgi:ketosteroid isomerase-like protein
MPNSVPRAVIEAFYQALASCDMQTLAGYLDDDVTWTISGPVDVLPFCGRRSGKSLVLKLLGSDIPALLHKRRLVPADILVDGDRVAVFGRLMARRRDADEPISYRIAQFARFRGEKIVEFMSIIDSFDAVEQVLGHAISLEERRHADTGALIAV